MEQTLVIIKPDAIHRGIGMQVMKRFTSTGLTVRKRTTLVMTREMAAAFYHEHLNREGFGEYLDFMASGPITAAVLEGEDAINKARTALGSWDPQKAQPGTVRKDFGIPDHRGILNIAHASDSIENATREIGFFFTHIA